MSTSVIVIIINEQLINEQFSIKFEVHRITWQITLEHSAYSKAKQRKANPNELKKGYSIEQIQKYFTETLKTPNSVKS